MTARQLRRAAERNARKEARKQERVTENPSVCEQALCEQAFSPAVITEARLAANRANAQLSTGPTSAEGKAISSQNNFRHGLTGTFKVLASENQEDFDQLLAALRDEHQPSTPTEDILVSKMAEQYWLSRRAQSLQDVNIEEPKAFALYLRYQTTNDRAFLKCLNELIKFRAARLKQERGFESQKQAAEANAARVRLANARAEQIEIENELKTYMSAPLPGHKQIPVERVTEVSGSAQPDLLGVVRA